MGHSNVREVVVVGAGVAGSVAAWVCARQGLRTLLLERKALPRDKSCSGVQFPGFLRWLDRAGLPVPREVLADPPFLKGAVWVSPGGKRIRVSVRLPNFWRRDFDGWLVDKAREAGAEVEDRCSVRSCAEGRTIRVEACQEGRRAAFEARYLVAGDGATSAIRKRLLPSWGTEERAWMGVSYQEYWKDWRGDFQEDCHIFLNPQFSRWFFAWALPKDGLLQIGTADMVRSDVPLKKRFSALVQYLRREWGLEGRPVIREGTHIPYGERFLHHGMDRILLAGDAARLLDWGRGVGMDQAARSGHAAGEAVVRAVRTGEAPLSVYGRNARRVFRTARAGYRIHRLFFGRPAGRVWMTRMWGAMNRVGAIRALERAGWI